MALAAQVARVPRRSPISRPRPSSIPSAPAGAADLFDNTPARSAGAPCITSPITGTLMPRNWLRPRFDLQPASGDNLFEVDLSVPGFAHPLRLFSANPSIALDRALWDALRVSVVGKPITVTARGLTLTGGAVTQGPSPAATTSFTVAPVDAPGKIVYWALADDMGAKVGSLKGFGIGEEGVQDVLVPSQVPGRTATEKCVGCHAATPDGNGVGFTMGPDGYTGDFADIRRRLAGQMPTFVSPTAITTMRALHGIPAFSPAHWSDGDRLMLLSDTGTLHWVELSGGATGTLARTGDKRSATEPTFSHKGEQVVYVSGASLVDGRLDTGPADLYTIPFATRAGGAATPLPGASDAAATEYYPAFSPDDPADRLHPRLGVGQRVQQPGGRGLRAAVQRRAGRHRRAPDRQRRRHLPVEPRQPRADQRLAEVVTSRHHRR